MKKLVTRILAGAALVGLSTAVQAADMGGPGIIPAPIPHAAAPVDTGGWYLRGDIGVGIQDMSGWDVSPAPGDIMRTLTLEDTPFVTFGVGYQFNEWIRLDLTGTYRASASFSSLWTAPAPSPQGNEFHGKHGAFVGLANAYLDAGNFYGLTPYIGGGIGFATHFVSGFYDVGIGGRNAFGVANAATSTTFAWALHAGVSYDVSSRLKLDIGYSYTNLGEADLGRLVCTPACGGGFRVTSDAIDSHDLRLGMRWMLSEPTPVYHQPPVIAKN